MKKILVTTDLSANSKAAMRFAIQLASQGEISLTFLHVLPVQRPTVWHESTYLAYEKTELEKGLKILDAFVNSVYKGLTINTPYTCVVENGPVADNAIMAYAANHGFDFICLSIRGAGTLEKIIGTTTANLINQSAVPVIAVPGTYRAASVTSVLYASDLTALKREVPQVADFARMLTATVTMLHIIPLNQPVIDPDIIDMAVQKFAGSPVDLRLTPRDFALPLMTQIEATVRETKASMLILFTTQDQGFFHQLFATGNAVSYSFLTTVPLLVFAKK